MTITRNMNNDGSTAISRIRAARERELFHRVRLSSAVFLILMMPVMMFSVPFPVCAENYPVTVHYSGAGSEKQTITVDFSDDWLLLPDDAYNHKLMQASFALAAAGFRAKDRGLSEKDHDILDFFAQAGFTDPITYDYNVIPSVSTIGTAIAHKKTGSTTLIAISISGNNYQREWISNMMVDDENRVKGFNDAAEKVMERLQSYIREYGLEGELRLWVAGFSRSAAVTNIFAADAVDSGIFSGVYAYTIAAPRTTKDPEAGKYKNIFNVMNPFDAVPMVPFPEWGFVHYGTNLYLPSIETVSNWLDKYIIANEILTEKGAGTALFNPQVDRELHTVMDYIAFFINSSASYTKSYQKILMEFMDQKDVFKLIRSFLERINLAALRDSIIRRNKIAAYQAREFYNFLDYIAQVVYTSMREKGMDPETVYWDSRLSLQENLAYNHYDKTYRAWLFLTDDPEELFSHDPGYIHYTITGDVDVELFDEAGNFIERIDRNGDISIGLDAVRTPSFSGRESNSLLYADRQGKQTIIVMPMDQIFTAVVHPNKDQTVRYSYVEFYTDRLKADVRYIYYDEMIGGGFYTDRIGPLDAPNLTKEELTEKGFLVVEPWSEDIVYSPTSVMRLENEGVFHPTPVFFFSMIMVLLLMILFLIIFIIRKVISLFLRLIKRRLPPSAADPG